MKTSIEMLYKTWNLETLLRIHGILQEYGPGFPPAPEYQFTRLPGYGDRKALSELVLPDLRNFVLYVSEVRGRADAPEQWQITFMDRTGMLASARLAAGRFHAAVSDMGLEMPQYTPEELVKFTRCAYKYRYRTLSETGKERVLIRMPDRLGTVRTNPELLTRAMSGIRSSRIVPTETPVTDDGLRRGQVGNNLSGIGPTVEQYVRARYAYLMTAEIMRDYPCQDPAVLPPVYERLMKKIPDVTHDNWSSERLAKPPASGLPEPDPAAYDVLTKINSPMFERTPENRDTKTFDRIRIYLGIKTKTSFTDRMAYIKRYRKDIVNIALLKIEQSYRFGKYGVPVNCLKPVEMTVTASDEIEILFELRT